jgi:hypothetical protein
MEGDHGHGQHGEALTVMHEMATIYEMPVHLGCEGDARLGFHFK